ncbi:Tautomerase [Cordyceps fumosorosea ARSEF 2679]|uniref:Tautomerase n=1 Tax=Cordyceps fumosorosea (strain ARSEF 2679) TaxID=1081104 RepID=A0A168B4K3_CORFA|nr:Tautomerase [Cordyceps fumosorosea ARSEF 2679]OAA69608.1 Tautomerase [Cordyceps fumosorosea ARSEF 2679]
MPLFEVHHSFALTDAQKQSLAEAITAAHVDEFNAPPIFVNVRFIDTRGAPPNTFYVAGRPAGPGPLPNGILYHARYSTARTKERFDRVTARIEKAWYETVGKGGGKGHPHLTEDKSVWLHAIGVTPTIASREAGFNMPTPEGDKAWIEENLPEFERLAAGGSEMFKALLEDIPKLK